MSAKQEGIISLRGTVGNLTFYKSADGTMRAKQKSSIDKQKMLTSPSFKRVREQMAEFSTAAKAASILRNAAKEVVKRVADRKMQPRLSSILMQVLKTDTTNPRGSRTILDGDISLLKGFQFSGKPLTGSFMSQYNTVVNRITGKLSVEVPGFNPDRSVIGSTGSTHFQLHAVGLSVDFLTGNYTLDLKSTDRYSCTTGQVPATVLETSVPPNSSSHLFLLFGIEFFVETNGVLYELNNKIDNALEVAEASKA